jgi:hypothetical protein
MQTKPLLLSVCCCAAPQVAFPAELDVYDFCVPELQQQLKAPREAWKNHQDMLAQQKRTAKQLKTEDGPKPGPGAAAAELAAAGGSSGDVEMRDAEGGAAADAGASSSSVVGALTGEGVWREKGCWGRVSDSPEHLCHATQG